MALSFQRKSLTIIHCSKHLMFMKHFMSSTLLYQSEQSWCESGIIMLYIFRRWNCSAAVWRQHNLLVARILPAWGQGIPVHCSKDYLHHLPQTAFLLQDTLPMPTTYKQAMCSSPWLDFLHIAAPNGKPWHFLEISPSSDRWPNSRKLKGISNLLWLQKASCKLTCCRQKNIKSYPWKSALQPWRHY